MTIKDIAKECGCAVGTVSRVLNNHPDVSDATRQKVMEIVEKYGFVLNTNARILKAQSNKNLVIIVKGSCSILLNGLLEKCLKHIENTPYEVSVIVIDEYDNEAQRAIRVLGELKPMGIIFLGGCPDAYEEDFCNINVPCVLISAQADNVPNGNLSSVSTDGYMASGSSAKFLIYNGHTKIGVIGGELKSSALSRTRYQGFLDAIKAAGLSFDEEKQYVTSKYSFEGGACAAEALIKKFPDLTAIYTMSDVMAIGAMRRLKDMGYQIPQDISIIGFDGLSLADYCIPRLSTIKQLQDELVQKGMDVLLNCIERKASSVHIFTPYELIEGESVRKIN